MNLQKYFTKNFYYICTGILFIIAFFLRFYRLNEIPDILHIDEASVGYNAWCLANFGVDRYLNEMPIYPQNMDFSGQSPLYTYFLALLCKFFKWDSLSCQIIRFPSLFFSMIIVVIGTKMFQLVFEDPKFTLAGTALMTFCPYFIMHGRLGLDCNLMLGTSTVAITTLLLYLKKATLPRLMICGAAFSLVLYSYALSYIALPLFLIGTALYMLYTKQISWKRTLFLAVEIIVLCLPIILFVICLVFKLDGFKFLGFSILPIASDRMNDFSLSGFGPLFLRCTMVTLAETFYPFDSVETFYTMFITSVPFIALGFIKAIIHFIKSIKSKNFYLGSIFLFWTLSVMISVTLSGEAYLYRANAIFVSYVYFCLIGIKLVYDFVKTYRRIFILSMCFLYAFWSAVFIRFYFAQYSVATFTYPNQLYFIPEREALTHVMENSECTNVYIDSIYYEFVSVYYPMDPHIRQNNMAQSRNIVTSVNYNTPIASNSIYMVHKHNSDTINNILASGIPYTLDEYKYYYVFTLP